MILQCKTTKGSSSSMAKNDRLKSSSASVDAIETADNSVASNNSDYREFDIEEATPPKPFFIMDWLEQIDPADLELAQRMLKTPQKNLGRFVVPDVTERNALVSNVQPSGIYSSSLASESLPSTPPRTFSRDSDEQTTPTSNTSLFRRRSISIGNGWNAKGLSKAKQGLWEDALACWDNALAVRKQVLGDNHRDVANTYNNMGIAYGKIHQSSQAVSLLRMALDIRMQHYGPKHPLVAATLHNMGNILQQSGDLDEAIEYFERAKDIQEDVFSHQHAQVARACVALGHAYFQRKYYEKAHESFCEALVIFEQLQVEDCSDEVESTRADIQELEELMYRSEI